ncbi:ABC transporter permease [Phototrophicus methaneseepsis]|uniref:ABC transporter permease n=1 Tax=Phototrophicus methaneseepsis TaxID=2710758 RepID=A0A7S8ECY2_9CHLR|nr:ABC transporter permease [Phototrophicus methaneseepsis]QPC84678.1 ABC transporter permease [Phototrophicus methaneseepsis]
MKLFWEYILPRVVQWFVVIFVGVTVTFLIPRLSPNNPVDSAIGRLTGFQTINPEATLAMRESLLDMYGLEGTLFEQYARFWGRILKGDLGPSFTSFPTPVTSMIGTGLGWTIGLLGTSILISWVLGLVLGSLAGYFRHARWAKLLEGAVITVYPVPYYILAFILLILFTFYFPLFPLVGGARGTPAFTWEYISSVLYFGFLPALSIVIGGTAFRFIMSKALASTEVTSDYVQYADLAAIPKRKILFFYVIRNTMLPQITDLALTLGAIFEGALITEIVFGYPGIGYVLFNAINTADYNVIMGITLLSIVGIATASLLVDLMYPLFDPRVRLK